MEGLLGKWSLWDAGDTCSHGPVPGDSQHQLRDAGRAPGWPKEWGHPHLVGAKSQDSDPKSHFDPSAATVKLLKFRFYRMKLWNLCCPQRRSRFCWGRSWPGFNPVVLPTPSTPHFFFFLFPKPKQMPDRRTLGSLPPSLLAAGSLLNSAFPLHPFETFSLKLRFAFRYCSALLQMFQFSIPHLPLPLATEYLAEPEPNESYPPPVRGISSGHARAP